RTTPPLPTRSLPTSNCGLTRSTKSASGLAQAISAGSTRPSEMNERSAVTRSGAGATCSGRNWRTLTRSSTVTRSSVRNAQASWPYPTSTAMTCAAPARSRTSVNPPVDAPASRHLRPATRSTGNAASAPAGARHLPPAPGRVLRPGRLGDRDRVTRRDLGGRLGGGLACDQDASRSDQAGGLLTGPGEPPPHQFRVQPSAGAHAATRVPFSRPARAGGPRSPPERARPGHQAPPSTARAHTRTRPGARQPAARRGRRAVLWRRPPARRPWKHAAAALPPSVCWLAHPRPPAQLRPPTGQRPPARLRPLAQPRQSARLLLPAQPRLAPDSLRPARFPPVEIPSSSLSFDPSPP